MPKAQSLDHLGAYNAVIIIKQLKHRKVALFSYRARYDLIEFSNYHTENEAKLSSFVQFENEMESYRAL